MDLIPQLTGTYAMDDDHGRQVMRQGQVKVFLEGLQLQGKDLEIIQGSPFFGELFNMKVQLGTGRLQVLARPGSLVDPESGT